ncbi:glutathione peroxidase [Motilimonas pumila]|uniref:Glutathione peroxidase n=1 Tax=Motilimonas pumila TaxID=2303987 RepID=A0A418YIP0_9GAMM|nr:glutathione peroxidase [Motilimonas pumila]RJG50482.1 glutathione peroxidase [Motilimonas pumila]
MLDNKEGQAVPQVTFQTRQNDQWVAVTSDELFKGKTVALFALPGAFTPTCSSTHLPRYNELAGVLKENGVDEIVCLSVNDTFVMNAWLADQEAENITVIPDGNGEFSEGMGMLVDKSEIGFGKRSWRYSMLVKDGIIDKMFIEPNEPGDPFKVSDADTMLNYINAEAKAPAAISIITKPGCPFCAKAKALLADKGLAYEEVVLGTDATSVSLKALTGRSTVPQVFIDGQHIGGSEELAAHLA